jgi:type VI secretion system protein ImpI
VALAVRLQITNTQDGTAFERTFDRFPIRIGRNQLNDLQIDFPFVSQFHAVLELHGNQLMLRDLGSKNGTLQRGIGKVPPNTLVDLAKTNYEFAITTVIFQAFAQTSIDAAPSSTKRREGMVLQSVPEEPPTHPLMQAAGGALAHQFGPLYEQYRASWEQLFGAIQSSLAAVDPQARSTFCQQLAQDLPAIAGEADFKNYAFPNNAESQRALSADSSSREERVALQGLRELASWYLPAGKPVTDVDDIVGFLQNVQDTLDVFLKCFVPLRDGYKQFESQMDIKKNTRPPSGGSSQAGLSGVDRARNPSELAQQLLDWRNPSRDGSRAVESTFADLMIHQVAMLNGVMKGVKTLLAELAPQTIERALEDPKRKGTSGIQIGPFRYKQLWDLYASRYSDLADEEKEAFALIFGPQFVQAYAQFAGDAAAAAPSMSPSNEYPVIHPRPPYRPPRG